MRDFTINLYEDDIDTPCHTSQVVLESIAYLVLHFVLSTRQLIFIVARLDVIDKGI